MIEGLDQPKKEYPMLNVSSLKAPELLVEYNKHAAPIAKWSKKVSILRDRLVAMKPDLYTLGETTEASADPFEAPTTELAEQAGRPVDHPEETVVKTVAAKKEKKAKPVKPAKSTGERGVIKNYVEELLLKVKGTDEKSKRPLGLTYAAILEAVQKKFPDADTSVNCLRWYATKLNKRTGKEKVVMPVRPKSVAA